MKVHFRSIEEPQPGERWASIFREYWPGYSLWFHKQGDAARPSYLESRRALKQHMPELVSTYERLVELLGGGDAQARFLSLYNPTPYITGCSQAVWTRDDPFLVRNYDYAPMLWDGVLLKTKWTGREVIAMSDCMWGVLDGVNDAGLAVSLAFGGRKNVGEGFGIPLILRYILETCDTTAEAAKVLERVPSHMSYNVVVVDASGAHLAAFVAPDRPTMLTHRRVTTNHQRTAEWIEHTRATASIEREQYLRMSLRDPDETPDRFANRFLQPPLFSTKFSEGMGTLYTALYRPATKEAVFKWPHATLTQSFSSFQEIALAIEYRSM